MKHTAWTVRCPRPGGMPAFGVDSRVMRVRPIAAAGTTPAGLAGPGVAAPSPFASSHPT
jgi:hypothetical protein